MIRTIPQVARPEPQAQVARNRSDPHGHEQAENGPLGLRLVVCPALGNGIPRALPHRHCLQRRHRSAVVHLAWEDTPRLQCPGSAVSSAIGFGFARHLVQCTAVLAVNNVLPIALPAPNLPNLGPCLRPGTSPAADLCLAMTGWVASAYRKPVSGEEHPGITGDRFPPPHPRHTWWPGRSLRLRAGALCHRWCRLPPPLPSSTLSLTLVLSGCLSHCLG